MGSGNIRPYHPDSYHDWTSGLSQSLATFMAMIVLEQQPCPFLRPICQHRWQQDPVALDFLQELMQPDWQGESVLVKLCIDE